MISIELLRRYPFFAGLEQKDLVTLSKAAHEYQYEAGEPIFHEGDELDDFFLVIQGRVGIVVKVTDRDQEQKVAEQIVGNFNMKGVTTTTVNEGQVFGWSALVPPHTSTAGAKALSPSRVVAFNCVQLRPHFDQDHRFGHLMLLKAAQIIRERLRDQRIESLVDKVV